MSVDMIQSLGFRVGSRSDTCWVSHEKKKQPKHFEKWNAQASYGCPIFQNAIQVFILCNVLSNYTRKIQGGLYGI